MQEKRQNVRFKVKGRDVVCRMMFARKMEINDISVNGISLKADRRMEIGRVYQFKFECQNKVLPISGTVVWSMLSEMKETLACETVLIYKAGVRFRDSAKSGMVRELIEFVRDKLQTNSEV